MVLPEVQKRRSGAADVAGIDSTRTKTLRFWLMPSRVSCVWLCPSLLLLLLLCFILLLVVDLS